MKYLFAVCIGVDYLLWAVFRTVTLRRDKSLHLSAKVLKPQYLFGLIKNNCVMWNCEVIVCSSMVTNVCITSEYPTHSGACVKPKVNIVDML